MYCDECSQACAFCAGTYVKLRDAARAALDEKERRCDVCAAPIAFRRDKYLLVGKPNYWCTDCVKGPCGPAPGWSVVPDEYQHPIVAQLREALGLVSAKATETGT